MSVSFAFLEAAVVQVTDEKLEGLTAHEKLVLIVMASLCDDTTGSHFWSHKRIAQKVSLSVTTLKKVIKSLSAKGLLTVQSGKDHHTTNLYKVNLEPVRRPKQPQGKTLEEKLNDFSWADKEPNELHQS